MDDGVPKPLLGSDQRGLEQTIGLLVQQQASLMAMQRDLRNLVEHQHKQLEMRLADLAHDSSLHQSPRDEVEEEDEKSHADSQNPHRLSGTVPGLFKKFSNNKSVEKVVNAAPVESFASVNKVVQNLAEKLVKNEYFEVCVGCLIIFHFLILFSELQYRREALAYQLGLRPDDAEWNQAEPVFKLADRIFVGFYLFEWLLRLIVVPGQICRDLLGGLDTLIILLSSLHSFILDPLLQGSLEGEFWFRVIRLLRVVRLFRILRVLRIVGAFSALRIFVNTIITSIQSLLWSMALVSIIIVTAAMVMNELISPYVQDENYKLDMRLWMFKNFGGSGRASYSMFEATFSGKWATQLGPPLVNDASGWFCVFWILYVVFINFAVIRVIAALFLKQTMDVARVDAERIEAARMREREKVMGTLREIFRLGDTSGDGLLKPEEFVEMMQKTEVTDMFESIELEPPELCALFHLLAEDDGAADQEEFLAGAMCLKNPVRNMDLIRVLHGQMVMRKALNHVEDTLKKFPKNKKAALGMMKGVGQAPIFQPQLCNADPTIERL